MAQNESTQQPNIEGVDNLVVEGAIQAPEDSAEPQEAANNTNTSIESEVENTNQIEAEDAQANPEQQPTEETQESSTAQVPESTQNTVNNTQSENTNLELDAVPQSTNTAVETDTPIESTPADTPIIEQTGVEQVINPEAQEAANTETNTPDNDVEASAQVDVGDVPPQLNATNIDANITEGADTDTQDEVLTPEQINTNTQILGPNTQLGTNQRIKRCYYILIKAQLTDLMLI